MTSQEQDLLSGLIDRVNNTTLPNKDTEAERYIANAFGSNPDAPYILCQTVLVQQFAMDNAQRQLAAAQAEIAQLHRSAQQAPPEEHGSFLGNLFGLGRPQQPAPPQQGYAPAYRNNAPAYSYPAAPPQQPGYGYGGYAQPPMQPGPFGGGGGGFLQNAMQTAAGVVAGEFAFNAIENMMHGGGGGGGRGFEGNETANNYHDAGPSDHGDLANRLQSADNLNPGLSPDIEDRRNDFAGDAGSSNLDDSSNFDDSSSFDDSGSGNDDNS